MIFFDLEIFFYGKIFLSDFFLNEIFFPDFVTHFFNHPVSIVHLNPVYYLCLQARPPTAILGEPRPQPCFPPRHDPSDGRFFSHAI